jgi:hypothetical protein
VAFAKALLTRNTEERFRREIRLAFLYGYIKARGLWKRPAYAAANAGKGPRRPEVVAAGL